jgi:hypothetical protein
MIKVLFYVGLTLFLLGLFVFVFYTKYLYLRSLRKEGRIVGLAEARNALIHGDCRLVRLGRGRQSEIWLVDAISQVEERNDIFARYIGKLVVRCDAKEKRDLIDLAKNMNSFVDVPNEPDVDPA